MGHRGWVVACTTYKRETEFNPRLCWICSNVVFLGKALCLHMHSLDPGVSGYLVGQWRLVCLNSSVCRKWQLGVLPQGVDGLWINRSHDQGVMCEFGWAALCTRYQTINLHLYKPKDRTSFILSEMQENQFVSPKICWGSIPPDPPSSHQELSTFLLTWMPTASVSKVHLC